MFYQLVLNLHDLCQILLKAMAFHTFPIVIYAHKRRPADLKQQPWQ